MDGFSFSVLKCSLRSTPPGGRETERFSINSHRRPSNRIMHRQEHDFKIQILPRDMSCKETTSIPLCSAHRKGYEIPLFPLKNVNIPVLWQKGTRFKSSPLWWGEMSFFLSYGFLSCVIRRVLTDIAYAAPDLCKTIQS